MRSSPSSLQADLLALPAHPTPPHDNLVMSGPRNANSPEMAPGAVKNVLDAVTASSRLFQVSPGEEGDGRTVNSTWPF